MKTANFVLPWQIVYTYVPTKNFPTCVRIFRGTNLGGVEKSSERTLLLLRRRLIWSSLWLKEVKS